MKYEVIKINYNDTKGRVVFSSNQEKEANDTRDKMNEETPISELAFFFVKDNSVKKG